VGLAATAGNGQASLAWAAVPGDVVRYQIHQGTVAGSLARVAEVTGATAAWVATGLANGTTYYFAVAAVDSAGTVSPLSAETSALPLGVPRVALASPGDNATNVSLDATLVVSFSHAMSPGTVTVTTAPTLELGEASWDDAGTFVFFVTSLAPETTYTVQVAGVDPAGNGTTATFHFSSVGVPPTIDATSPSPDAVDVPTTATIQLVFSERMNTGTLAGAVTITPGVTCAWSWIADGTTAICGHATPFTNNTSYLVTVGAGVQDLAGNGLAGAPFTLHFNTAAAPHTLAPAVVSSAPASGATGVSRSTTIQVTFNEAVDKASAQTAFQIVSPASARNGLFSWSTDGKTMTYALPSTLAYGQVVSWQITTALECLGGIPMAADVNRSFTAIRQATATLYPDTTLSGYLISTSSTVYQNTALFAGDGQVNEYYRSFLAFSLAALPATATAIDSATLYGYQESTYASDPYPVLGGKILSQSVDYGTGLTSADFETAVLTWTGFKCSGIPRVCVLGTWNDEYTLSTSSASGWRSVDVTGKVARDLSARSSRGNRCQFRLRFPTNTNSDLAYNYARWTSGGAASNRPYLTVTYEYP
jgi:methionine-rich copper-binding protein CopC